MVAFSIWPFTAGNWPSWPAETCTFWLLSATIRSDGISAYFSISAGSIQMRIA